MVCMGQKTEEWTIDALLMVERGKRNRASSLGKRRAIYMNVEIRGQATAMGEWKISF